MPGIRSPKVHWLILACGLLSLWPLATFAQTRHLEVVHSTDPELERTAGHLGMTPARLRDTRKLLEEATNLALREDLDSTWQPGELLGLWRRIHPTEAIPTMERLLDKLRDLAAVTPDPSVYGWTLSAAGGVVAATFFSTQRFDDYVADWPSRTDLGDPAPFEMDRMQRQMEQVRLFESIQQDPLGAAREMLSGGGPDSLRLTAQLAHQLRLQGESEIAVDLVEASLDRLRRGEHANRPDIWNFLFNLARLFPDHYVQAVEILHSQPPLAPTLDASGEMLVRTDRGETLLTSSERRLLQLLRGARQNPQVLDRAEQRFPELGAKLEKVGGLAKALRGEVTTWDKEGRPQVYNPHSARPERFLYQWGDAVLEPAETRRRLRAAFEDDSQLPSLLEIYRIHCRDDLHFSRIALDFLADRLFHFEPLNRRMELLAQFLGAVRYCEGTVEPGLLDKGFEELESFRKNLPEPEASSSSPRPMPYGLEAVLLAALSDADVEAAMERIRNVPAPREQMRLLVAVVKSRLNR